MTEWLRHSTIQAVQTLCNNKSNYFFQFSFVNNYLEHLFSWEINTANKIADIFIYTAYKCVGLFYIWKSIDQFSNQNNHFTLDISKFF